MAITIVSKTPVVVETGPDAGKQYYKNGKPLYYYDLSNGKKFGIADDDEAKEYVETLNKIENYKSLQKKEPPAPSVPITKIDIKNGNGVPGGFSGAAAKNPLKEMAKYATAISSVVSSMQQIKSTLNIIKGDSASLGNVSTITGKLNDAKGVLSSTLSKYTKKVKNIKKFAPNFKSPVTIPKLPELPSVDVPKVDIPKIQAPNMSLNTTSVSVAPDINAPKLDVPKISTPSVNLNTPKI